MRAALLPLLLAVPLLAGCLEGGAVPPPWPGAQPLPYSPEAQPMTSPLPLLPLRVNAQGLVEGVPSRLKAYAYCSREDSPGLSPRYAGDEVLRYFYHNGSADPDRPPWFLDRVGQPLRAADLAPGQGALVSWRSEGLQGGDLLLFWVVRADRDVTLDPGLDADRTRAMLGDNGTLLAFSAPSPWFCCTLRFGDSALAVRLGHERHLFDPCHFPTFDPLHLVPARLPPCREEAGQGPHDCPP